ncbi:glycosyltransferase family 4 protein [Actinomycetospora straminea]|uniref:Glycosyltransferase n=1 Tax=Actinomycetospora straminea TaxID=663607 RepID=A0ABP9E345_9PSEU|nr:glycosyltransferase family 4 protein [Actinomycetospora straminea]MDD7931035.1 glycosyltransferase family 4 protein [Actinomycetospora straminea]
MNARIVHVSQPTTEGVPRCIVALVRHQVARGCRVVVVSPTDGWLAAEAVEAGAQHVPWSADRNPNLAVPGEVRRLRRALRDLDHDLVHLHSSKAGLVGRLAVRGAVPTVFQPHAWSFLAVPDVLSRATVAWERTALRWTHRVVCVSESEREQAEEAGVGLGDRARVVPNSVDTDRFAPRDRSEARRRLGLPADRSLAVCVGRLCEQKGQDVLLRAWRSVRRELSGASLALVGQGPWRDRLAADAGDGVDFVGSSTGPADWYAAADVVVVPSRWEGMALVPLEASAGARSVVMTDVAGARETVPEGCGVIVAREDPDSLAAAVVARLRDPALAEREGAAARAHVVAHHGLETWGGHMLAAYDGLPGARL